VHKKRYFNVFQKEYPQILFNLDPQLEISDLFTNFTLNFGIPIFGSMNFLNDIITCFRTFYSKKIPSMKKDIKRTLDCYLEILKISEGKTYFSILRKDLISHLSNITSEATL